MMDTGGIAMKRKIPDLYCSFTEDGEQLSDLLETSFRMYIHAMLHHTIENKDDKKVDP